MDTSATKLGRLCQVLKKRWMIKQATVFHLTCKELSCKELRLTTTCFIASGVNVNFTLVSFLKLPGDSSFQTVVIVYSTGTHRVLMHHGNTKTEG